MVDGTTIGAFFGFLGLVVTALAGVYVATRTNQTEKESTALKTLEETRDEAYQARLTLRDEKIVLLEEQLALKIAQLRVCKEQHGSG